MSVSHNTVSSSVPGAGFSKSDVSLLISLFLVELSMAVILKSLHMKGERAFEVFLFSRPGIALLCAVTVFLIGGTVLIHQYPISRSSSSRRFRMIVMMNLVTVVLVLVVGEVATRLAVHKELGYEKIGTLTLKPNSWEAVKLHYRSLHDETRSSRMSMYDDLLGWTIRPNGQSGAGLYRSSSEGLRTSREGTSLAKDTEKTDIALVGDSFTFGYEVKYEETYGYYLEQELGSRYRVLNFGVPGYGLDQSFLRYKKDVSSWKSKIVILGFISNDNERTMWVYPFVNTPKWKSAFSTPRFILQGEGLETVNVPPVPLEVILSRASISELPFIDHQRGYRPNDWEERFYHSSYLLRLFLSWFPAWSEDRPGNTDEMLLRINAKILKTFVDSVKQDGSIPLVIFFPSISELKKPSSTPPLGKQVLEKVGIPYVDPTSCLLEIDLADLYTPGHHYTSQGNAAVAKCVSAAVAEVLTPGS